MRSALRFDRTSGRRLWFRSLFLIAVLRGDKLRSQRQHLAVSDADQCGAQHDMVIFGLARASKSGAALRTLNLVRVVEFRPIQCHKAAPIENCGKA